MIIDVVPYFDLLFSSESHDPNEGAIMAKGQSRSNSGGGGGSKNRSISSEEVPLLGGERIEAVFKDMTFLCPYRLEFVVDSFFKL